MAITPVVDAIVDGGFEEPALAANSFQTDPTGMAWQFSGTAGVAGNGSGFVTNSTEAQNAPPGTQVGYIQDNGTISQTVYLDAGTYQVSFLAAQRAIDQTNYQEIEVLIDGTSYGTIDPVNTLYVPTIVDVYGKGRATHHRVPRFGPSGGDNTAFIDQVTLTANAISDGSFETPALDAGPTSFAPTGSSWQFSGGAGMASNGSTSPPAIPTPPTARRSPSSRATAA